MKIAFTSKGTNWDSMIDPRFGRTEFLLVYDEEKGLPEEGIEAGTRWQDIPSNWVCPECGAGKEDFDMVEG